MVTVIDIVCRINNECFVQIIQKDKSLFYGPVKVVKEKTELHRLVIDRLTPKPDHISLVVMNQ